MKLYLLFDNKQNKFLTKAYITHRHAASARRGKLELARYVPPGWDNKTNEEKQKIAAEAYSIYEVEGEPVKIS